MFDRLTFWRICPIHERSAPHQEKLMDFLQEGGKTIQEITNRGIIYNNRGPIDSWDLSISEKRMMERHLELLIKKGNVFYEKGRYFLT